VRAHREALLDELLAGGAARIVRAQIDGAQHLLGGRRAGDDRLAGGARQRLEAARRGGGVQDTQRDLLAELGRQAGDAQVDARVAVLDADAAVLRPLALGDVALRQHLAPRHERIVHPLGELEGVLRHAVDAVAHAHLGRSGSAIATVSSAPSLPSGRAR